MKIIGSAEHGAFIVTATEDELAHIAGYPYASSMNSDARPAAGKEIRVSELWRALSASRERRASLAELANKLRSAAARVDSINQALAAPIVEVEVKK